MEKYNTIFILYGGNLSYSLIFLYRTRIKFNFYHGINDDYYYTNIEIKGGQKECC